MTQNAINRNGSFPKLIFNLFLAAIFFLSGFTSIEKKSDEAKNLRVISYNIWNGFDWGKDQKRKEKLIDWMAEQKPDVVALQELCGYTLDTLLKDAKKWGHSYVQILKTSGYSVGITSNAPIEVKDRILENMHHGALHCKTRGIDFIVIHLSPFSYVKRQVETEIILEKLEDVAQSQNKYIILGDFNALSPDDADLYKNKHDLLRSMIEKEQKNDHVRNLSTGKLEYGVINSFLKFPLVDIVENFTTIWEDKVSFPTQVFEDTKGSERNPNSVRIDYILTSPSLAKKCSIAKVLNKKDAFYLSDHYPILAEFEF